jgi:hypothetical protein
MSPPAQVSLEEGALVSGVLTFVVWQKGEVVPRRGIEPLLPCGKWILNPPRLPIPPPWLCEDERLGLRLEFASLPHHRCEAISHPTGLRCIADAGQQTVLEPSQAPRFVAHGD